MDLADLQERTSTNEFEQRKMLRQLQNSCYAPKGPSNKMIAVGDFRGLEVKKQMSSSQRVNVKSYNLGQYYGGGGGSSSLECGESSIESNEIAQE